MCAQPCLANQPLGGVEEIMDQLEIILRNHPKATHAAEVLMGVVESVHRGRDLGGCVELSRRGHHRQMEREPEEGANQQPAYSCRR